MTVYLNGQLIPKDQARISPDDRGFLFADGVYEVVRAYDATFFRLADHLERLARGVNDLQICGIDPYALEPVCHELLKRNNLGTGSALVYFQITRGAALRVHAFPKPPVSPTVYLTAFPFKPKADPVAGVSVITVPDIRWSRCDIKVVGLLPNCLANEQAQQAGAIEAIFVRDGVALEATASSFFAVFNGEVRTAPCTNYILPSITRAVVIEICREAGIPIREAPIHVQDLAGAQEAFLASTTLEVMPIVRIDTTPVGDGRLGSVTGRLQELFRAKLP